MFLVRGTESLLQNPAPSELNNIIDAFFLYGRRLHRDLYADPPASRWKRQPAWHLEMSILEGSWGP